MTETEKLGPELKLMMQEGTVNETSEPLVALVRVEYSGLSDEHRVKLEEINVTVRSEVGDVVTMMLPVSAVAALTAFDWIIYVEASRPLSPEVEDAPPRSAFD